MYTPLIESYLSTRSLVRQHIDSFNYFIEHEIRNIVFANSIVDSDVDSSFFVRYTRVFVDFPKKNTIDGTSVLRNLSPHECRLRDDSYLGSVYVDIEYVRNKSVLKACNVLIGKIPIMLKSNKCHLTTQTSTQANVRGNTQGNNRTNTQTHAQINTNINTQTPTRTSSNSNPNSNINSGTCTDFPVIYSESQRNSQFYRHNECPLDTGGYFIVKGIERVVLIQEQLSKNRIILEDLKGVITASVTSSTAEKKSKTLVYYHAKSGELFVRFNSFSEDIPFVVLVKALGVHGDRSILKYVGDELESVLEPSIEAVNRAGVFDAKSALKFVGERLKSKGCNGVEEARIVVTEILLPNVVSKDEYSKDEYLKDEYSKYEYSKYEYSKDEYGVGQSYHKNSHTQTHSSNYKNFKDIQAGAHTSKIHPSNAHNLKDAHPSNAHSSNYKNLKDAHSLNAHKNVNESQDGGVKNTPRVNINGLDTRIKAIYLCIMARRVLQAISSQQKSSDQTLTDIFFDDKDFTGNKRFELAGQLLGLLFEDQFKRYNTELKKSIDKNLLKRQSAQSFDVLQSMNMQSSLITNSFLRAISTGNWVVKRFRMERAGVTQVLSRLSYISALGMMSRVNSQFERTRKVSGPRALHTSQWGFLCPADTPEGESCGLVKNLALMAEITTDTDPRSIVRILYELGCLDIDVFSDDLYVVGRFLVFLNGMVIGTCGNADRLIDGFRKLRRQNRIHKYVSISKNSKLQTVNVSSDGGRITRALIRIKELTHDQKDKDNMKFDEHEQNEENTYFDETGQNKENMKYHEEPRHIKDNMKYHEPGQNKENMKYHKPTHIKDNPQHHEFTHIKDNITRYEPTHIQDNLLHHEPTHHKNNKQYQKHTMNRYGNTDRVIFDTSYELYDYLKTNYTTTMKHLNIYHKNSKTTIFAPHITDKDISYTKNNHLTFDHFTSLGKIEYLDVNECDDCLIALNTHSITKNSTHIEIQPFTILGTVSSLIPFPDHNQSPRNTYQCAMGKQSMGYIAYNMYKRFDTLLYILSYSQKPLVKSKVIDLVNFDKLPAGQNAIVAVMSYSGYDIEDALVMNRSSIDRGYGRCEVYKNYTTTVKKYLTGGCDRIVVNERCRKSFECYDATDIHTQKSIRYKIGNSHKKDTSQKEDAQCNSSLTTTHDQNNTSNIQCNSSHTTHNQNNTSNTQCNDSLSHTTQNNNTSNTQSNDTTQNNNASNTHHSPSPRNIYKNLIRTTTFTSLPPKLSFTDHKNQALDSDGISSPGTIIRENQTFVNLESPTTLGYKFAGQSYKNKIYPSIVDKVLITKNSDDDIIIKSLLKQVRRPEIGDKFSSRHGQKGIIGLIVDQEDMPVSESGICPDIIMNPHGFPSRMTVGKVLELLCAKAGVVEGKQVYSTPFIDFSSDDLCNDISCGDLNHGRIRDDDGFTAINDTEYSKYLRTENRTERGLNNTLNKTLENRSNNTLNDTLKNTSNDTSNNTSSISTDNTSNNTSSIYSNYTSNNIYPHHDTLTHIKHILTKNGYAYTGKDIFYCGKYGTLIPCYIYFGPIYYQKLKHMVSDKIHARSTGPKAMLTRQPTEGRQRDGGLRLGEMERDCLIGYGASALLIERLLISSDKFETKVCDVCGIITNAKCKMCGKVASTSVVIPYACKLLFQELMGMNILPRIILKQNK